MSLAVPLASGPKAPVASFSRLLFPLLGCALYIINHQRCGSDEVGNLDTVPTERSMNSKLYYKLRRASMNIQ